METENSQNVARTGRTHQRLKHTESEDSQRGRTFGDRKLQRSASAQRLSPFLHAGSSGGSSRSGSPATPGAARISPARSGEGRGPFGCRGVFAAQQKDAPRGRFGTDTLSRAASADANTRQHNSPPAPHARGHCIQTFEPPRRPGAVQDPPILDLMSDPLAAHAAENNPEIRVRFGGWSSAAKTLQASRLHRDRRWF